MSWKTRFNHFKITSLPSIGVLSNTFSFRSSYKRHRQNINENQTSTYWQSCLSRSQKCVSKQTKRASSCGVQNHTTAHSGHFTNTPLSPGSLSWRKEKHWSSSHGSLVNPSTANTCSVCMAVSWQMTNVVFMGSTDHDKSLVHQVWHIVTWILEPFWTMVHVLVKHWTWKERMRNQEAAFCIACHTNCQMSAKLKHAWTSNNESAVFFQIIEMSNEEKKQLRWI